MQLEHDKTALLEFLLEFQANSDQSWSLFFL